MVFTAIDGEYLFTVSVCALDVVPVKYAFATYSTVMLYAPAFNDETLKSAPSTPLPRFETVRLASSVAPSKNFSRAGLSSSRFDGLPETTARMFPVSPTVTVPLPGSVTVSAGAAFVTVSGVSPEPLMPTWLVPWNSAVMT